ncbi:MAG: hypothetical protein BWY82_00781 [Verrucomicrobia bacterium ADurb.Bin474]|nr:MAG: hypothetical protein BWY82_00781 [Verrucomicrobia bacterium ADurb.Bin474]
MDIPLLLKFRFGRIHPRERSLQILRARLQHRFHPGFLPGDPPDLLLPLQNPRSRLSRTSGVQHPFPCEHFPSPGNDHLKRKPGVSAHKTDRIPNRFAEINVLKQEFQQARNL